MAQKNKKAPPHSPQPQKLEEATAQKPATTTLGQTAIPEISPRSYPHLETPVNNQATKTPIISTNQIQVEQSENQPAINEIPAQHVEKAEPAQTPKESIIEDTPATEYTLPEEEKKSGKKMIIIASLAILIVVGAIIWFLTSSKKDQKIEEKTVETAKTQEATITPPKEEKSVPAFDRTKITLEILNGSGIAGAAKETADRLSSLGYQTIKVANASEEVANTQVFLSSEMEKFKSEFLKDLETDLKEATISGELEDSTASARIIIGKD